MRRSALATSGGNSKARAHRHEEIPLALKAVLPTQGKALVDRCSERKESAEQLSARVNQRSI